MFYPVRYSIYCFLAIALTLVGCNSSETIEQEEASAMMVSDMDESQTTQDRKIVRSASIRFQVKDLLESSERVESLLSKYKAQLVTSEQYSQAGTLEANYTIKVVPSKLNALLKEIQRESIFLDSKNISAEDITMRYIDVEARLKAKRAVEQRYLLLLQQADKVNEIVAIETELNKIREELEVAQAQKKEMDKQINYSTISLTMYQFVPTSYQDRTSFYTRTTEAFEGGWHLLKSITIGIFYLWPIWILIPLIVWIYRQLKRRKAVV